LKKEDPKFDQKSRRLRERIRLALPVRVQGHDQDQPWTEMTRLIDVTPFGAGFPLSRPTEPGRLLHLTLAMPRALRVFDHVEDQYRIWSIVRNVRLADPAQAKGALLEVGVAFIGKRPPDSFEANPLQRYEIAETRRDSGLSSATETLQEMPAFASADKRRESRQLIPVDVRLEVYEEGKLVKGEDTVTENISAHGAAIFTSLDLQPGAFVRVCNDRQQLSVLAVVRGRRQGADGITRLHLEFIGGEWPL
jgi:PilZ domain